MKSYHAIVAAVTLFCAPLGCYAGTGNCTTGEHASDAGTAASADVGAGGHADVPLCKRVTDANSGAVTSDCAPPADPSCATMYCGDDGKCHEHDFPIGAVCSKTDTCDGMGTCKTLDVPCSGGCDDGNECTIDNCQTDKGVCFYENMTEIHTCQSGGGHCNRDTGACCDGVITIEVDKMFPDFKYYHCAVSCPVGQSADPLTGVCK